MDDYSSKKSRILIVDDSPDAIKVLANALPKHFTKQVATSGEKALELLAVSDELPNLILLDIVMPVMDGYEVCKILKASERLRDIPVIFLSGRSDVQDKVEGLNRGGVDYITKPFEVDEVRSRVDVHLKIHYLQQELERHNQFLEQLVEEKAREITEMQLSTIYALVKLTDRRDDVIGGHLERTQQICMKIAQQLGEHPRYSSLINADFIDNIFKASPLHDIGKVGISDQIYLKPGKLTPEEFDIMKKHTVIGAETLKTVLEKFPGNHFIRLGINIALSHHEKWDGSGYPDSLSGEAIPISARIMAVADVFDALRSKRPYKKPFSHEESIQIIREGRGTHFDPAVADAFLKIEQNLQALYF